MARKDRTAIQLILFAFLFQLGSSGPTSLQQSKPINQVESVDEEDSASAIPLQLQDILTDDVAEFETPAEFLTNYVYYLSGFDRDQKPVWILEVGKWDLRKQIEQGQETLENFDRFVRQAIYRMLNSTRIKSTTKKPVSQAVLILDFDGLDLTQLSSVAIRNYILSNIKKFLPAFASLDAAFCINTNFLAETLINVVRPIMGKEFSKIEVYGINQGKWMPRLTKNIPRDQLPPWYGGSNDFKPYKVYG